jgi:hypothetical protein
MKKDKRLVSFGSLGFIDIDISRPDANLFKIDKALDHDFKITSKNISTIKDSIEKGFKIFISVLNETVERVLEYREVKKKIQEKIQEFNNEFKDYKFIKVNFNSNLKETIKNLEHTLSYMSQIAVYSIEYPLEYEIFDKIVTEFCKEEGKVLHHDYKSFGKEARGGYSIFDRTIHHYNNIKENKCLKD